MGVFFVSTALRYSIGRILGTFYMKHSDWGRCVSNILSDIIFDAHPGDLFVLRNAGNTLTQAESSMVGSTEYSVCSLGVNLVVILGHTHCGAIAGATKCMLDRKASKPAPNASRTTLSHLLASLQPITQQAQLELQGSTRLEEVAAYAVYVNVFNTVEKLLSYSAPLREKCQEGSLQVHGAVYDIVSGKVDFLGEHPRLSLLLGSQSAVVHRDPAAPSTTRRARANADKDAEDLVKKDVP